MRKRKWWANPELRKLDADDLGRRILESKYLQKDPPEEFMKKLMDLLQCSAELAQRAVTGGRTLDQLCGRAEKLMKMVEGTTSEKGTRRKK